jgi:hypothetical protein
VSIFEIKVPVLSKIKESILSILLNTLFFFSKTPCLIPYFSEMLTTAGTASPKAQGQLTTITLTTLLMQ